MCHTYRKLKYNEKAIIYGRTYGKETKNGVQKCIVCTDSDLCRSCQFCLCSDGVKLQDPPENDWNIDGWRSKPIKQQPDYADKAVATLRNDDEDH